MTKLDDLDFSNLDEWKTFDEIEEMFPGKFNKVSLNWAMRTKHTTGLDKITTKFAGKNLIHLPGFSIWLSEQ